MFGEQESSLRGEAVIPVIREQVRRFTGDEAITLKNKIAVWAAANGYGPGKTEPTPAIKYISRKQIPLAYSKKTVENEVELEQYTKAIKDAWRQEIQAGKRIQLTD